LSWRKRAELWDEKKKKKYIHRLFNDLLNFEVYLGPEKYDGSNRG
jgi:hypothetical protein